MADIHDLRHNTPAFRTFAGDDALAALPRELARLDRHRALLVCDHALTNHPKAFGRVEAALGERLAGVFDGVQPHSPVPSVQAARAALDDSGADAVVAMGGGSAVVTARAAAILHAEKRDVRELCTRRANDGRLVSPKLQAPKLPIWVVPSTPITAYAKAGSAVRDPQTGERLALFDPKTRAQGIILDPVVALTAPEDLARGAALNAFAMAVESLQSSVDDPLADALLVHALRLLVEWLPRLHGAPDDPEPRLRLMLAALLSGQGSDYAAGGLAQALSHAAGPRSSVGNGVIEALLLPHTLRFTEPAGDGQLVLAAEVLDRTAPAAAGSVTERTAAAVGRTLGELGIPARLRDAGVERDALCEVADHAMDDWALSRVPRPPAREELIDLLRGAW